MGKASSTKKVARAARAGGNRGAGQRRNLGFPATIVAVVVLGLLLVLVTRNDRIANAAPRVNTGAPGDDHWHVPYNTYTCVPDPSTPVTPAPTTTTVPPTTSAPTTSAPASGSSRGAGSTAGAAAGRLGLAQTPTTDTTLPATTLPATTLPATTTTLIAQPGDVPGVFQAPFKDASSKDVAGIHTHGDGVIHIHPFNSSGAGRNATLKVFLAQVGVTLTDDTLSFTDPTTGALLTYKEGTTKCEGGKDGIVQVGLWDKADDAANGLPPNQVITSGLGDVRLRNAHVITIAFLPRDSRIPSKPDVKKRIETLSDLTPSTTAPASGSSPASSSSSGDPSSSSSGAPTSTASSSSDPTATTVTTVPPSSSAAN